MLKKLAFISLMAFAGSTTAFDMKVVDTKGDTIAINDLLASGKYVYLQWSAQY